MRDNGNGQEKDMADVGKNIKKIRKEKNLTQDELAKRLHCTRQTVSNYENGKSEPGIDLLIEIAGVLEVQINDLIYGPKKRENRRKQKVIAVMILLAAIILLIAIALLAPAAERYAQRHLILAPHFLLNMTFRPIAQALLGWGIVEMVTELFEMSIKKVKHKKIVRAVFYVLLVCLSVLAFITLWMGTELTWEWYMYERAVKMQGSFSSSDIQRLIPAAFWKTIFYTCVFASRGGAWCYSLLGAALDACRKMKNE